MFLLEKILIDFNKKGKYISVKELHSFPSEAQDWKTLWNEPFLTQNLVYIFEALLKMLKREWESISYNMDKYLKWPGVDY